MVQGSNRLRDFRPTLQVLASTLVQPRKYGTLPRLIYCFSVGLTDPHIGLCIIADVPASIVGASLGTLR